MKRHAALVLAALSLSASHAQTLRGAGATFPESLYRKMWTTYATEVPGNVEYSGFGSGAGQLLFLKGAVDFGASDMPLEERALKSAPGPMLHVPAALGAVVVGYNVPGVRDLRLDGRTLANIFLAKITRWNDPALQRLNPNVLLPDLPITLVVRKDGSGTTGVFTEYLSKVSPDWEKSVGAGTRVRWPKGLSAAGNSGVAKLVAQARGALGYMEEGAANKQNLAVAAIRNRSGAFVKPSASAGTAAAAAVPLTGDRPPSLTDSPAANGYPISSYSFILVYRDLKTSVATLENARALKRLLTWMVTDGQKQTEGMTFAAIPPGASNAARQALASLKYDGASLP